MATIIEWRGPAPHPAVGVGVGGGCWCWWCIAWQQASLHSAAAAVIGPAAAVPETREFGLCSLHCRVELNSSGQTHAAASLAAERL